MCIEEGHKQTTSIYFDMLLKKLNGTHQDYSQLLVSCAILFQARQFMIFLVFPHYILYRLLNENNIDSLLFYYESLL